jgi:transposase
MRGADIHQDMLFSTVIPEERVPADHPLRPNREMVSRALKALYADFTKLYLDMCRDSIAPEKLLRAQLLMAFYTIRSERQLMEQIDYNLLFRWFIGFSMDDKVWNRSVPYYLWRWYSHFKCVT